MKYIIFFCLLFTINISKDKFTSKLEEVNSFIKNNNDLNAGIKNVCEIYTEDECIAITNPKQNLQCCFTETSAFNRILSTKCEQFPKDINNFKNIIKTDQYKESIREPFGYTIYNKYNIPFEIEENITCNNGEISMIIDAKDYSENEQKILKDENHCLKKRELKETDINYDVGKCEEGIIVESSRNAGLECGYFIYNIKIDSKNSIYYKTCNLFNFDLLYNISKLYPQYSDKNVWNIINRIKKYDTFESYTSEIYNKKGLKIKYDSITGKTIYENAGYMLTESKYIFLLILILL